MLYINENEKNYIKSLYYTANLNEQIAPLIYNPKTGQMQGSAKPPTWGEIKALGGEIYQIGSNRYNLKTSEGRHNLLDDGELLATFASAGGGILVGIFHSFYYFWEGVYMYATNEIAKTKAFFLGLFQLITALPGIGELKFSGIDKWIDVIKNSKNFDWLVKFGDWFQSSHFKFSQLFEAGLGQLNRLKGFIQQSPKLKFLSSLLELIIKSIQSIAQWFNNTVKEILVTIRELVGKQVYNVGASKIGQIQGNDKVQNFEKTIDTVGNIIDKGNQYLNPKAPQNVQNTKNTQTVTQDTTDPRYYEPKTMPTTLNKR